LAAALNAMDQTYLSQLGRGKEQFRRQMEQDWPAPERPILLIAGSHKLARDQMREMGMTPDKRIVTITDDASRLHGFNLSDHRLIIHPSFDALVPVDRRNTVIEMVEGLWRGSRAPLVPMKELMFMRVYLDRENWPKPVEMPVRAIREVMNHFILICDVDYAPAGSMAGSAMKLILESQRQHQDFELAYRATGQGKVVAEIISIRDRLKDVSDAEAELDLSAELDQ